MSNEGQVDDRESPAFAGAGGTADEPATEPVALPPALDLRALTRAQMRAVTVMAEGGGVGEAAAAAGRDRRTVWRWSRHHPEFIAELNRRLRENDLRDRALAQKIRNAGLARLLEAVESGDMYAINLVARTSKIFDVRLDNASHALDADDVIGGLVDREMERSRIERSAAAAAGTLDFVDAPVESRAEVEDRVEAHLVASMLDALPAAPAIDHGEAENDSAGEPQDGELGGD